MLNARLGWGRIPVIIVLLLLLSWSASIFLDLGFLERSFYRLYSIPDTWVFPVIVGALGIDIIFPIPSTIIYTIAGNLLGLWTGFLAIFSGMSVCSIAGYLLGRFSGKAFSKKILSIQERGRMEKWGTAGSRWLIMVSKGLPLMNETVCITCGFAKMGFVKYLAYSFAGTVPVAFVYAYLGNIAENVTQIIIIICACFLTALFATYLIRKKLGLTLGNKSSK